MMDGSVLLWKSQVLLEGGNEDAIEVKVENGGVVSAVKFCPFEENGGRLLAW